MSGKSIPKIEGFLATKSLRDDVLNEMADYLAANETNAKAIREEVAQLSHGMTPHEHAILMSFLEARPSYLKAFFDEAETQYGSFTNFVAKGLRLTPEQIDVLKFLVGR